MESDYIMSNKKLFCDVCGGMISRGICSCNRPDPPTKDEIVNFSRDELREILYECPKNRRIQVAKIAAKWNHNPEETHKILWFLEKKSRVAGGNYNSVDRVYIRVREPNRDLDAQVDAVVQFISENYEKSQSPSVRGIYYKMKSQGFEVSKRAIYMALNDRD